MIRDVDTLLRICQHYLQEEPDADLRAQVTSLLNDSQAQIGELYNRFDRHLVFGTAGLRGRMEAGYNRMNLVSVYRFSFALAKELLKTNAKPRAVIGFDGRINSKLFARECASILCALGFDIHLFDSAIPTPIAAYAVKHFEAHAGVMVTASHNPKNDNGIKLFNQSSAQAHGPILRMIEKNMVEAPLRSIFFNEHQNALKNARPNIVFDEVFASYLHDIKQTALFDKRELDHSISVVYTPLHGVGKRFFLPAIKQDGFLRVEVVASQAEPDGQFPTVVFPNPEENHTLDCAERLAISEHIPLVFANDPDADRLQVSAKDTAGHFRKLSGNEMGVILGYFTIKKALALGVKPLAASSIVSSRMLKTICDNLGASYVDALTGFSNIIKKALQAESETGHELVFAYEEAIGFLVGQVVLDKDGINTGARFMEIAAYLARSHRTVWDLLDELLLTFGLFVSEQWSIRFDGVSAMTEMANMMANIRAIKASQLASLFKKSECDKYDLLEPQGNKALYGLESDVVIFEINQIFRLIVRPSGTEPKIKYYLEIYEPAPKPELLHEKMALLRKKIKELKSKIEKEFSIPFTY